MILAQLHWPELKSTLSRACVVPLGSLEQHGPHLPLCTDTTIVTEIARRLELRLSDSVVLAPEQPIGYSPHHAAFGCLSLDLAAYMALIRNVCHSFAVMGFRRILLLNGHGGNDVPCRAAMCELKVELPDIRIVFASYWTVAAEAFNRIRTSPPGGMGHACEMETSIMLALHPEQVHLELARDDGPITRAGEDRAGQVPDMLRAQPYYMVRNFDELSSTGTVGSPSHASAAKGELFLDAATQAACALVTAFTAGELDFTREPG
jgi:creatinine amidohydrolase